MTSPIAEINVDALRNNLAIVRQYAPNSKVLAILKANAYGHGLIRVAQILQDADAFAVGRLEEALLLRKAGIQTPIIVMMGFLNAEELNLLIENDLQSVVHSNYQIELLYQTTLKKPLKVWMKIETGLNRLGFLPDETHTAYQRLMACEQVQKPLVIMSHLACAEALDNPKTSQQLQQFLALTRDFAGPKSMAKSAAVMAIPNSHLDWVRPGGMLYGISPFKDEVGTDRNLQPVMTLRSKLISVKQIAAGETIGYGETWRCEHDIPVGVVGIGYADGYPRYINNNTPVLVNGIRCNIIGRVSMDMITVDLRPCIDAKPGDTVTLWGDNLPIETIARCANSTATLLAGLTPRVQFIET